MTFLTFSIWYPYNWDVIAYQIAALLVAICELPAKQKLDWLLYLHRRILDVK